MEPQSKLQVFRSCEGQQEEKLKRKLEEKEAYIKKLELQIEHQKNTISQFEKRVLYFEDALEQANQRLDAAEHQPKVKRKRGRPALSGEQRKQVASLVHQGMSYRKVQEITGISLGMISAIMKDEILKNEE